MTPAVTVVVCSRNGADSLPATLTALGTQTIAAEVEVIVVDDGSTDDTAQVAEAAGARVIRHDVNRGLAAARNTGWRAAAGPIVAFTDDDCRPEPTWLALLLAGAERHPSSAAVGGDLVVCGPDSLTVRYLRRNNPLTPLEAELLADDGLMHRLFLYLKRSGSAPDVSVERPVSSVVGANMAFRAEVLASYGGFDERFRFGGEEEDLCRRLVLDGHELTFVPAARVQHDFEAGLMDTLRRSRAYGRGNARMFLKHEGLRPTVYPLPLLVAGLVGLAVVRRSAVAAIAAAAAPLALFSRWPREAVRERRPELLLYPYVQLAQETCGNVGLVEGLRQSRQAFSAATVADDGKIDLRDAALEVPAR